MRIALGVEYDGSRFAGFELQRAQRTVQGALEEAIGVVANHPVRLACAGRTDSGVHAVGQVVHIDTTATRPERAWVLGVNTNLPYDVSVRWAREMPGHFHARFSATGRAYRYFIYQRRARSPLLDGRAMWRRARLDVAAMQQAAACLVGEHDFSAFRAAGCQSKVTVRRLESLSLQAIGGDGTDAARVLQLDVRANAFLQHMVRNIVGTLVEVGAGERPASWVAEVLRSGERRNAGPTAPPQGLVFMGARYAEEFGLDAHSVAEPGLLGAPVVDAGVLPR